MAGFNTAVTGLKAATTDLDVTGNNIANASTVGFKSSRTEFGDIYATAVVGAGSSNVAGSGVTVTDIAQDFQAGTIEFTNNNLDLAINGSGFFQLDDGQGGVTYTRAGAFELDKNGFIVSKSGKFLQGYGLDSEGNRLPIGNLAVTQKESPPKATEEIDLSFNIDSREDATKLLPDYNRDEPGSFTYSTTVRTFDSLGNEHTIKFNLAEARPNQAQQQIKIEAPATALVAGDTISGYTLTAADIAEITAPVTAGTVLSTGNTFYDNLAGADPRIAEIIVDDPATGEITLRFKAEYPEPDLVQVTGGITSAEHASAPEIRANETHSFGFDATAFTAGALTAAATIEIGGVSLTLDAGLTQDQIGDEITAIQAQILDANPDIESVIYSDSAPPQLVVTYKAEAGNVPDTDEISISATSGANPFVAASVEKTGDSSFEGVYRMYAYLNGSELLDIGKDLDPGEVGNGTEPGPILVKFNPTNGLLTSVDGSQFTPGSVVPSITITGADPADPTTSITLDITNTTQFASASIVKASQQDGFTKGDLVGVTFNGDGEMVASFSNGQNTSLGVVAIATFENQSGLQPSGDTEWTATLTSGDAIVNPPGTGLNGTLQSAALEQSNVDLSTELVNLIEAQRNFQANSKTLETMNTVTQNILQI